MERKKVPRVIEGTHTFVIDPSDVEVPDVDLDDIDMRHFDASGLDAGDLGAAGHRSEDAADDDGSAA
jgi:hypothetical protein